MRWPNIGRAEHGMDRLKRAIDLVIYSSALLGALLILVADGQVPDWLLVSLIVGEVAYAATAFAVARGSRRAYVAVVALALLVLAVSLPQPEHYAFATSGQVGAFLLFAVGSVLQVCLLVAIPIYLRRKPLD